MSAVPAFTEESTSRLVRVRAGDLDLQLHYNDIGTGDQVVVMLHGSGPGASGWSNFNRNIEPLVARGYRVLLMDCPGWSKSDSILLDKGSRAELNARSLKGFLDALKIDKAHLVGNSMGAHSVVMFTLMFPERAGKIIMIGGGTGGPSPFSPGPLEGIKLIQRLYRNPTVENVHRMMEVFVYDTSNLTEALFKSRLDNMMARQDHLENFWKSFDINPRQYADVGHRLGELLHRHRFTGQQRLVHPQATATQQPRVGGNAVACLQQ